MFDPKIRVLLVDDMPIMRKAILKNINELGFLNVTEASDGVDAWTKISSATAPFDLVIADCEMPHGSGLDLLTRIRGNSKFSKTLFLFLHIESEAALAQRAIHEGANESLLKPFSAVQLQGKLAKILGSKR